MLQELIQFCLQTVTIAPRIGVDSFGEPYWGEAKTYRCRISGQRRLITGTQGEQVLATQRVHLVTAPAVSVHDLITLSTQDAGSTETASIHPGIAAAMRVLDDLGRPHVILDLNPWSRGSGG